MLHKNVTYNLEPFKAVFYVIQITHRLGEQYGIMGKKTHEYSISDQQKITAPELLNIIRLNIALSA
jgi:hypothetical protein